MKKLVLLSLFVFVLSSYLAAQIDADRVFALRRGGLSWSQVCRTLNVSKGSAQRSVARLAEKHSGT
jgi:hypothetical protein